MRIKDFIESKVCENSDFSSLEVFDYFLTPELESQKATAKPGDIVTMYKIIEIKENGNVVYTPVYPTLE
jgi:hypothetical protein